MHQIQQNAFPNSPVGNRNLGYRPKRTQRLNNSTAGNRQIRFLRSDARMFFPPFVP